jgi:hypothetical protein
MFEANTGISLYPFKNGYRPFAYKKHIDKTVGGTGTSVFLLSVATLSTPFVSPGTVILDKIEVNLSSITGSTIPPPKSGAKTINWVISGGLSFEEDVPFSGSFLAYAKSKLVTTVGTDALCVEYYAGRVFVGGVKFIKSFDATTLSPILTYNIPFDAVSIKAYASGFIATSVDHKIYNVIPNVPPPGVTVTGAISTLLNWL